MTFLENRSIDWCQMLQKSFPPLYLKKFCSFCFQNFQLIFVNTGAYGRKSFRGLLLTNPKRLQSLKYGYSFRLYSHSMYTYFQNLKFWFSCFSMFQRASIFSNSTSECSQQKLGTLLGSLRVSANIVNIFSFEMLNFNFKNKLYVWRYSMTLGIGCLKL